jgi:uncharacterized protein (TIGR03067 family)
MPPAWIAVAVSLLPAAGAARPDAPKKDQGRLQGGWVFVSAERNGNKMPAEMLKQLLITFAADKIVLKENGKVTEEARFTLDPAKKPPAMDVTHTAGRMKGKTALGIYQLEKDTLKLCFSDPGKGRPGKFEAGANSGLELIVLKKKK